MRICISKLSVAGSARGGRPSARPPSLLAEYLVDLIMRSPGKWRVRCPGSSADRRRTSGRRRWRRRAARGRGARGRPQRSTEAAEVAGTPEDQSLEEVVAADAQEHDGLLRYLDPAPLRGKAGDRRSVHRAVDHVDASPHAAERSRPRNSGNSRSSLRASSPPGVTPCSLYTAQSSTSRRRYRSEPLHPPRRRFGRAAAACVVEGSLQRRADCARGPQEVP